MPINEIQHLLRAHLMLFRGNSNTSPHELLSLNPEITGLPGVVGSRDFIVLEY